MSPLSLEALQVIDAIERRGSFAGAAEALHRVPSAITYSINKLEQELGVALFRREGRRAVLTPAGRVLLEQGRDILQAVDRLAEQVRRVDRGWETRLVIGVDSLIDFAAVYPIIEAFYAQHADTEVRLQEEVLGGALESLMEGRADLVVGMPELALGKRGLRSAPLMQVDWVFAVAPQHPLARARGPLRQADIARYRAVVASDTARQIAPVTRRVFERQPVLAVPTVAEKIRAQCQGLGVGFLPAHRIQRELASGALVAPPLAQPAEPTELFLVWRSGDRGRALRWFIEAISQADLTAL